MLSNFSYVVKTKWVSVMALVMLSTIHNTQLKSYKAQNSSFGSFKNIQLENVYIYRFQSAEVAQLLVLNPEEAP